MKKQQKINDEKVQGLNKKIVLLQSQLPRVVIDGIKSSKTKNQSPKPELFPQ